MEYTISEKLATVAKLLNECPKGGFATIKKYVATSGRTVPEVSDVNFISKFSVTNIYKNRIESLKNVKPSENDDLELFLKAKEELIKSLEKTLSGDRSDAQRSAHDTFYVNLGVGVVGHFKTTRTNGKTTLVLNEKGEAEVDSILLNILENGRKVIKKGEYKQVKSRPLTIMKRKISKQLPKSTKIKRVSLKNENF